MPSFPALATALVGLLEPVRVHGRHDVDPRVVHQPRDVDVLSVVHYQVLWIKEKERKKYEH